MEMRVRGVSTEEVDRLRKGGLDSNGQVPLVRPSTGLDPCRHCLDIIAEEDEKLVLGYRPFDGLQPYAETGPIFLHRKSCPRYDRPTVPDWFEFLEPAIVRGYAEDDWIRYDTGHVVPASEISSTAESILHDDTIAYVHIRSKYNCFQCRVDRA